MIQSSYPRIYSFSTIGIKQHYNCNYLFHPYRTDFSGESGSGKSMVADMLQLILVGSKEFKSSTDSHSEREPKGIVLEPKGKQHGFGYAFLVIELYHNNFLVIGVYVESSNNKVQPFVIQNGYDWEEKLTPFSQPIFYKDLLIDDKILPLEDLARQLTGFNLKVFNWKSYHQLLFDNELLALDLTNNKTLESFASIVRSFSRGKGFKTDSSSLKKFLFGDSDQDRLMQQYQEEVKGIENDYHEHSRYIEEIKVINDKHESISTILNLSKGLREKQQEYHIQKNWYWLGLVEKYTSELKDANELCEQIKCKLAMLSIKESELEIELLHELQNKKNELVQIEESKKTVSDRLNLSREEFKKSEEEKRKAEEADSWLSAHENSWENVKSWRTEEVQKAGNKNTLERFVKQMKQQDLLDSFATSDWCNNYSIKRIKYQTELRDYEDKMKRLNALSAFSNLSNPQSLALWAKDNLTFPLSHEQESVLIYFQKLPRETPQPENDNRYLPFPEELFDNLDVKERTTVGFWINLDGIFEYIHYSPKRYLNTKDVNTVFQELSDLNKDLDSETLELINTREIEVRLKDALDDFGGIEHVINLYQDRDVVSGYEPASVALLDEATFEGYFKCYENRQQIQVAFSEAKRRRDKLEAEAATNDSRIIAINKRIGEIEANFDENELEEATVNQLITPKQLLIIEHKQHLLDAPNFVDIMTMTKDLMLDDMVLTKVLREKIICKQRCKEAEDRKNGLEKLLSDACEESKLANQDYCRVLKEDFGASEKPAVTQNPDGPGSNLKSQLDILDAQFKAKYDLLKETTEDKAQLIDYSVAMLAHKLLPTVFASSKIDENLIDEQIAERLTKLTRDIQEIGTRKIEILKQVFNEVYSTYNLYLEKVRRIDGYLKKKDHAITGGNKASLSFQKSRDYPDKWMAPFRKQLDEALLSTGLFADLKQEVDINKMMIRAFQNAGGSVKVTPKDLLNPKSYFDLSFDLKLDTGQSNAGSQGQTYTANALLGLARLSLIEFENRNGLRIMPIDEAEGLGSNYDMLHKLAKQEGYQIVSMSIETAGDITEGEQYIYIMNDNNLADESSYVPPFGIFSGKDIVEDLSAYIQEKTENE